jgi:hypothetical protein
MSGTGLIFNKKMAVYGYSPSFLDFKSVFFRIVCLAPLCQTNGRKKSIEKGRMVTSH